MLYLKYAIKRSLNDLSNRKNETARACKKIHVNSNGGQTALNKKDW